MNIYMKLGPSNLRRPFRAFYNLHLNPRAHALGFPARPLRGPEFRNRNQLARRRQCLSLFAVQPLGCS